MALVHGGHHVGTYIDFCRVGHSPTGKTYVWEVLGDAGSTNLGTIKYFGRWNQYAFFPESGMVFEKTCLREIADFCAEQTSAQRKSR